MPRRRRVLPIALLLVLLGAGGGYRLAHGGGPSPALRTVTVGLSPGQVVVDAATDRAFVNNHGVNTNAGCVRAPGLWQYVPSFVRRLLPFLPGPPRPDCNLPGSVSVIDASHL
jgi:hypothetical protein